MSVFLVAMVVSESGVLVGCMHKLLYFETEYKLSESSESVLVAVGPVTY